MQLLVLLYICLTNQISEPYTKQLEFVGCSYKIGQVVMAYPPSMALYYYFILCFLENNLSQGPFK